MIIHFIPGEKFLSKAIFIFERTFPNKNHFYVFVNKSQKKLDNLNKEYVTLVDERQQWWKYNFFKINSDFQLVFHNLYSNHNIHIATQNQFKFNKKHFIFWGASFYNESRFYNNNIFGGQSIKLRKSGEFKFKSIVRNLRKYLLKKSNPEAYNALWPKLEKKIDAFKSIDVIHTDIDSDYHNLTTTFNLKSKLSFFSYNYIDDIPKIILGNQILIGNSASVSNNHYEIFIKLKKIKNEIPMVCPLNYGDINYSKKIIEFGKEFFGEKFIPLTQFLEHDEYFKIQSNCGIVIMNHYRQQAVGNLIVSIYIGAKVFLSNKSELLDFFRKVGLNIYSIEDDLKSKNDLQNLDDKLAISNRLILKSLYSLNNISKHLVNSFSF